MGKASKWIRNFLIGKKEERYKQIDGAGQRGSSEVESSKVKRKWSFGRRTGKGAEQKISTSFDLTDSAKHQIIQALLQIRPSPSHTLPTPPPFADIENAAATKIQAAFRSYLGRKALHALRGLVKLQALVRGHLVRKQTTATLRSMHALMAIQVRARIHRIQMNQESNLLREINKDSKDMSLREMVQVLRSRSGPLDRPPRKSIEHPSVSKRHHRYTAPNSPEDYMAVFGLNPANSLSTSLRHNQSWEPNYMTETESSRAKARSESEPKQRPRRSVRHSNKPTESMKDFISPLDGGRQYMSSNSTRFNHGKVGLLGY